MGITGLFIRVQQQVELQEALIAATEHGQCAVGGRGRQRLGVLEVIAKLCPLVLLPGHQACGELGVFLQESA